MAHPFGDLLNQCLHRKHGLSQAKLAECILQPPQVISLMCKGERLNGQQARERVVAMIAWLHEQGVLSTRDEANALLAAAGMGKLHPARPVEARLLETLSAVRAEVVHIPVPAMRRTNLPLPLTSFIGRDRELAKLTRLMESARLITLTGTGGAGKTRLAIELARHHTGSYTHGIWMVELAPLADPGQVLPALATALDIHAVMGRSLEQALCDVLRPQHLLLILDNCEHLLHACTSLVKCLLQSCPHLQILATSREMLGFAGEVNYPVPPLSLPQSDAPVPDSDLLGYESIRLFLDRAAMHAGWVLPSDGLPAVVTICRMLDGIPLAIELAAARVHTLSLDDLAARLDHRLRLLTGGSRTALPKQQTLRASLDWSYMLLSPDEQATLRRLSVFAGGWTLEAAEHVCTTDSIDAMTVLDLQASLIDKSLVQVEDDRHYRYRLLETVRQYAYEKLEEAHETEDARSRQLAWCLQLAQAAEIALCGSAEMEWLLRLERELDNIRAALDWALTADVARGLRLASALWLFWQIRERGGGAEGLDWLERLLAQATTVPDELRAKALFAAGYCGCYRIPVPSTMTRHYFEQSLEAYRLLGDTRGMAYALAELTVTYWRQGETKTAVLLSEQSLELIRPTGDGWGTAICLAHLGVYALTLQHDYERARFLLDEAAAIGRRIGNRRILAWCSYWLAIYEYELRHAEQAKVLIEEALAILSELGETSALPQARTMAWVINLWRGDYTAAKAALTENLDMLAAYGEEWLSSKWSFHLGAHYYFTGDHAQARNTFEAVLLTFEQSGSQSWIADTRLYLASTLAAQQKTTAAREHLLEVLRIYRELDDPANYPFLLDSAARIALAQNEPQRAACLLGAAGRLRRMYDRPVIGAHIFYYEPLVAAIRSALDTPAFDAAFSKGQAMELDAALAYAAAIP